MPTVYKVVRRENGVLKSAIITGYHCRTYAPGKKTVPRIAGCPLLAFRRFRDAEAFWQRANSEEIWRAEASSTKRVYRLCDMLWLFVTAFWRGTGGWAQQPTPHGTVACPDITLIEKVWPKEPKEGKL